VTSAANKAKKKYIYICNESDCAKDKKKLRNLKKTVSAEAKIKTVKCQKICEGPVAGTLIDGNVVWFERITTAKHREALLRLLQTGKVNKLLKKHECKKRSGKIR